MEGEEFQLEEEEEEAENQYSLKKYKIRSTILKSHSVLGTPEIKASVHSHPSHPLRQESRREEKLEQEGEERGRGLLPLLLLFSSLNAHHSFLLKTCFFPPRPRFTKYFSFLLFFCHFLFVCLEVKPCALVTRTSDTLCLPRRARRACTRSVRVSLFTRLSELLFFVAFFEDFLFSHTIKKKT